MFPDPASIHPGDTCYPKRFDVIVWAAAPNRSGVVHGALMPVGCLSRAGNRATPSPSAPDVHLPDASGDIRKVTGSWPGNTRSICPVLYIDPLS